MGPTLPRTAGRGPEAEDSDPRDIPGVPEGRGQVIALFLKWPVSRNIYTEEGHWEGPSCSLGPQTGFQGIRAAAV